MWCVAMPFYRVLGIVMGFLVLGVGILAYSALGIGKRRDVGMIAIIIDGRRTQAGSLGILRSRMELSPQPGPWARAIAQWVPRRWTLYTIHDWPPDLAFFIKRPVRQLRSPRFLEYQPGPDSKFVLLLPSELENWPDAAVPIIDGRPISGSVRRRARVGPDRRCGPAPAWPISFSRQPGIRLTIYQG